MLWSHKQWRSTVLRKHAHAQRHHACQCRTATHIRLNLLACAASTRQRLTLVSQLT